MGQYISKHKSLPVDYSKSDIDNEIVPMRKSLSDNHISPRKSSPKSEKLSKTGFSGLKSVAIVINSNEEAYINYVIGRLKMPDNIGTMDYGFSANYCITKYEHVVYVLEMTGESDTKMTYDNPRRNVTNTGKVYLAILLGKSGAVKEKDVAPYRKIFDDVILNYPTAMWPKY
jgi:hypothetical protein